MKLHHHETFKQISKNCGVRKCQKFVTQIHYTAEACLKKLPVVTRNVRRRKTCRDKRREDVTNDEQKCESV